MKKIKTFRQGIAVLAPVLLACSAFNIHAQMASENYENVDDWLCQGNPAVTGPQDLRNGACAPTAVANGLAYLEAYQLSISHPDPFTTSPDSYPNGVNALITAMGTTDEGTDTSENFNGLQSYLAPGGANPAPKVSLSGQVAPFEKAAPPGSNLGEAFGAGINAGIAIHNQNPSAAYLATKLAANDGVELGLSWGTVNPRGRFSALGGHEVTLESINMSGGSGTMDILDPWGAGVGDNAGTGDAVEVALTVTTVTIKGYGSFLEVSYPIGYDGPNDFGTTKFAAGGNDVGLIMDDSIESVPDHGLTIVLLGVALTGLMLRKQWIIDN